MKEIWKSVPGYEGKYLASSFGRIKSLKRKRVRFDKILNENSIAKSYITVTIGKRATGVHRIIALTFIPNPNNLPEVDHIDGNIHNNYASNLQWTTHGQNIQFGYWRKKKRIA